MTNHLDHKTAVEFLDKLPPHIKQAFYDRAAEIEYPIEAVLESAIAYSLDAEALSFADCVPNRSPDFGFAPVMLQSKPIDPDLLQRIKSLTADVEFDINEPLSDEDG